MQDNLYTNCSIMQFILMIIFAIMMISFIQKSSPYVYVEIPSKRNISSYGYYKYDKFGVESIEIITNNRKLFVNKQLKNGEIIKETYDMDYPSVMYDKIIYNLNNGIEYKDLKNKIEYFDE